MNYVTIEFQPQDSNALCEDCGLGYDAPEMVNVQIGKILDTNDTRAKKGKIICMVCHFKRMDGGPA